MARARKNPTFDLEGADEISRALGELQARAAGEQLQDAAKAGAKVIAEEAARLAPKKSGTLSRSIKVRAATWQQIGRARIDVGPTREAFYGRWVELGREGQPAKPYLRPAFDAKKDEAVEAVKAALRKALGL